MTRRYFVYPLLLYAVDICFSTRADASETKEETLHD